MEIESKVRLVEEEAQKRMHQSLYPELKHIVCNYHNGTLTLHGVVSSSHARRIAQELIEDLEGIETVDNQLAVTAPAEGSTTATGPAKPTR